MDFTNNSDLPFNNSLDNHILKNLSDELPIHWILLFIAFTSVSFLLNVRVVCIVLTMPANRRSPNILILHLSLVNIILNYFVVVTSLSRCNVWHLETLYGFCVGHSFIRNTTLALLPLNVTAVAFEKMIVLRKNYVGEKLDIKRTIALMWTAVLVGSLPNLLQTRYISSESPDTAAECRVQPILGSPRLTFSFELFRLVVYNFTPTIYMLYALVQIKSKVSKHLFTTTNNATTIRLRNKVRKVRFIVLNGVVFMLLWLPAAVLISVYKIKVRSSESGESSAYVRNKFHFSLMVCLGYIYIMLNPLIHLHFSEDLGDLKWYSMRFPRALTEPLDVQKENNIEKDTGSLESDSENPIKDMPSPCTSRVATFQHSTEVVLECHHLQESSELGQNILESDGSLEASV